MTIVRGVTRETARPVTFDVSGSLFGVAVDVTDGGGRIREGQTFRVSYAPGGLTGRTSVTVNDIACTSVTIIDDKNLTAVAITNGFLHGTPYSMVIS